MVIEEGDRRSSVAGYRAVLPRSGEEPVGDDAAHMWVDILTHEL